MAKSNKVIIIDADVISHFITGSLIIQLPHIFPFKIMMLDKVYEELERWPKRKCEIDNLLNLNLIQLLPFPEASYLSTESEILDAEVLASNNLIPLVSISANTGKCYYSDPFYI